MTDADAGRTERDTLSVRAETREEALVIEAVGVVTLGTADLLAAALRQATDGAAPDLIVDLRGVSFLDSSGLSLLIEASKRLRSPERPCAPCVLVTPGGQPEGVLRLGRYTRILEVRPT